MPRRVDASVPDSPFGERLKTATEKLLKGVLVHCGGCGAKFSARNLAATCCHCDSMVVAMEGEVPAPHGVLPFLVSEQAARDAAESKLPGVRELRRFFLPVLVLACDAVADTEAAFRELEGWYPADDDEVDLRPTIPTSGLHRPYDHRMVLATDKVTPGLWPPANTWDLGFVEPFDPRWLIDSECEHPALDEQQAFNGARVEMSHDFFDGLWPTGGSHTIQDLVAAIPLTFTDRRYRHLLLPAYLGIATDGRHFLVHGRTGKVYRGDEWAKPMDELDPVVHRSKTLMTLLPWALGFVVLVLMTIAAQLERCSPP